MKSSIKPEEAVEQFNNGKLNDNLFTIKKSGESIIKAAGSYMNRKKINRKWVTKKESYMILSCESAILFFADKANGMNTDNTYRSAPKL